MNLNKIAQLESELNAIRQGSWLTQFGGSQYGVGYSVYCYCLRQILTEASVQNTIELQAYRRIAQQISVSSDFNQGYFPAYHNHIHSCEAMIFATTLFIEEYKTDDEKRLHLGPRFLISIMAHDLAHPGRTAVEYQELEQNSIQSFREIMRLARANGNTGIDDVEESQVQLVLSDPDFLHYLFRDLQNIILGTEMTIEFTENYKTYHTLHDRRVGEIRRDHDRPGASDRRQNRLTMPDNADADMISLKKLANEADIGASCFPMGYMLGQALAEELNNKAMGTWAGRLYFLKNFGRFDSLASRKLGLDIYIKNQIHVIQSLGVEVLERLVQEKDPMLVINMVKDVASGIEQATVSK